MALPSARAASPSDLSPASGSSQSGIANAERDLAWGRNAIAFIRERGLETEFNDWCGGWPCPVETLSAAALDLLAAAEMLASLANDGNGRSFPTAEQCAFAIRAIAKAKGENQ